LIVAYSSVDVRSNALPVIKDFAKSKHVIEILLNRFSDEHEEKLAYCQYLLSRKQPLAVNMRSEYSKNVQVLFKQLRRIVEGVPSRLTEELLNHVLVYAKDLDTLLEADDETIFRSLN
jgi:hypothetical protein